MFVEIIGFKTYNMCRNMFLKLLACEKSISPFVLEQREAEEDVSASDGEESPSSPTWRPLIHWKVP